MTNLQLSILSNFPDIEPFLEELKNACGAGKLFTPGVPIYLARSPGRLDLMGGNDDYTGGLVFEMTICEATRVAIQPRRDNLVRIFNPQVKVLGWDELVEFHLSDLSDHHRVRPVSEIHQYFNANPSRNWIAYVLGGIYLLMKDFPEKINHGLSIFLESDVPIGKGVSSSAALEVAPLKAMAASYGLNFEGEDLAVKCQWIENAIAQSASGVMDQIAVVAGDRNHFVPLVCQPCLPEPLVHLPQPLRTWGIDSGVRHQVAGIEYEAARAATFMAYQMMCNQAGLKLVYDDIGALPRWKDSRWNGYLANMSPFEFRTFFEKYLPEQMLGADFTAEFPVHADPFTPVRAEVQYPVRASARYAVEENHRVRLFVDLLSQRQEPLSVRTCELLGEIMYGAHAGYSECGLGSDGTDRIVALVREEGPEHGLFGAKITGGGAGGTVAVLGRQDEEAAAAFHRVIERYQQATGYAPYIFEGSSPGADRFGVVTITL